MKVLLVPAQSGWAFDHRAKDLLALSSKKVTYVLKYSNDVQFKDQFTYDLIYPMTFDGVNKLRKHAEIPLNKMATGITSIRSIEKYMLNKNSFRVNFLQDVSKLRGINTASDEIVGILKPQCKIYKTRVGINTSLFKPASARKTNSKFTVGWVGRMDKPEYRELKGYDIVIKALKNLNVNLDIRTYKERVPRHQMVEYYQSLNCFICSSSSEHIPLPILEAAACGVPIITTKVGIVPELISHRVNGIIVERTAEAIRKEVSFLMNHSSERQQLAQNIRKTIVRRWTWETCRRDWEKFFTSIL